MPIPSYKVNPEKDGKKKKRWDDDRRRRRREGGRENTASESLKNIFILPVRRQ
ncbi:hypothetical protein Phum_PHUM483830 [Pediculus humanus corporis]|uniref:Uncharacterized protein n=1 Tax=Pediculus humanus subsp. corporis TaxID=121224 RepID=E0VWH7_PEDHC|nr:uncharacterized protein Phum_PHUM483830 [Pediculus humanus corporis]EEB17733.1 hypothetical protein Phum_PHUM483830 [Pediculus humanus corporis]